MEVSWISYIFLLSDGTAVKTLMMRSSAETMVSMGKSKRSTRFSGYPIQVGENYFFPKELEENVQPKRRKKTKSNTDSSEGTESVGMC